MRQSLRARRELSVSPVGLCCVGRLIVELPPSPTFCALQAAPTQPHAVTLSPPSLAAPSSSQHFVNELCSLPSSPGSSVPPSCPLSPAAFDSAPATAPLVTSDTQAASGLPPRIAAPQHCGGSSDHAAALRSRSAAAAAATRRRAPARPHVALWATSIQQVHQTLGSSHYRSYHQLTRPQLSGRHGWRPRWLWTALWRGPTRYT